MYGKTDIERILREVHKTGAEHIDVWPLVHGDQREQLDKMGLEKCAKLLQQCRVKLGIFSHFDLGPFQLQGEMTVLKKLGGSMIVCGARGPAKLRGGELKAAVRKFAEQMKPHVAAAERAGIVIGIENHANSLIETADSIRWFGEVVTSDSIGIALAPYHLEQNSVLIAKLINDLGNRLVHFYAWQHGMGCHKKLPKEQELLQLPGRGSLDFVPIVKALREIDYKGWTEIFMHSVPRGIAILESIDQVTAEINRSREYLESCLRKTDIRIGTDWRTKS
jgi:sugar phosphate isomerase/epimerase